MIRFSLGVALCFAAATAAHAGSFTTDAIASDPRVLDAAQSFTGVGALGLERNGAFVSGCTGALIAPTVVLSAGHCQEILSAGFLFNTNPAAGDASIPVVGFAGRTVALGGSDILLLQLERAADPAAEIYGLFRGGSELGREFLTVGFGRVGEGATGVSRFGGTPADGQKRIVRNRYEATLLDVADAAPPGGFTFSLGFFADPANALVYDFDNGLAQNDAFGRFLGRPDVGLGELESQATPGDSGAPTFFFENGVPLIAGVHSFSFTGGVFEVDPLFGRRRCGTPADLDVSCNDGSFGDVAGDAKVSANLGFIDGVLSGAIPFTSLLNPPPPPPPPVPAPPALALFGLGALLFARRRAC